jgi:acyl-CoA synthetase (AMP-forming)/AMP-acid ligase II
MVRMVLDAWPGGTSSLQRILYGAAPMPPALLREALDAWGCEFVNGYGSTESTGISALAPHEHDPERLPHLLGSVGRSFALSVPRLVDEDDHDVAQGEIGEVVARSAAMMSGYWRNPDATREALRGGFMHTGDLAYRDADGYLYLVDRRDDKIVTGGENVFPSGSRTSSPRTRPSTRSASSASRTARGARPSRPSSSCATAPPSRPASSRPTAGGS